MKYSEDFKKFPQELSDSYDAVQSIASRVLTEEEFLAWEESGLNIANRGARAWESAVEYFRATPDILNKLPFVHLKQWAYWGSIIAEESHFASISYFKASRHVSDQIKPWDVADWAQLGKKLLGKESRSGKLSISYFENSAEILKILTFSEFKQIILLVETISEQNTDEAAKFIECASEVLPVLKEDTRPCLSLISNLVRNHWQQSTKCLSIMSNVLARIDTVERSRFLSLSARISEEQNTDVVSFLHESSLALGSVDNYVHVNILNMADRLSRTNPNIVLNYFKGVPKALRRISINQLELWYDLGMSILKDNETAGIAFFSGESSRSEDMLEKLSVGVELSKVKDIMRLYCRALSAIDIDISPEEQGDDAHGKSWVPMDQMLAEGANIYLPFVSEQFDTKDENFDWFKVMATHQIAHLEFKSFQFSFDTPSTQYQDLRDELAPSMSDLISEVEIADFAMENEQQGSQQDFGMTEIQRFFAIFKDRPLARDIFTAVEDYRLDHRVMVDYPGIASSYKRVQLQSISNRLPLSELPSQEALVEILIRFSLQQTGTLQIPQKYIQLTSAMWKIIRPLSIKGSIVEDSAEATIRLYEIISNMNNQKPDEEDEDLDFEMDPSDGEGNNEDSQDESTSNSLDSETEEGSDNIQQYQSPQQVDYRGEFKPELMQAISMIKDYQKEHESTEDGISKEKIEQILSEADAPPSEAEKIDPDAKGTFVSEMAKDLDSRGNPQAVLQQSSYAYDSTYDDEDRRGPLEANDPDSFLYDEWDYRISDYRNRWCLLREKEMAEGDSAYFTATLDGYSSLASQIRRQFELMSPQGLQKMKRQQDGDELELEAVIEAMVDKKSGSTPSEKVYLRRNKVQRDVAVVFLLDMSASTAEAIDETRRIADEWDAPDDPLEYMFWLRSRRGEGMRRSYKRIVDLEKESIVLLIHALETIGDTYGIYGFSGYGRENVDFFVIKDVQEALSERVKRRIDKISPLQATRMGPAIRHATSKLAGLDARTKFLVLISDGRPQDRGYSREGVEKEYAIHDTRIALTEARRDGVTPFCLTVDKEGHDYLRAMCQDMGYEVLADINNLPRRLPALYRHLTV